MQGSVSIDHYKVAANPVTTATINSPQCEKSTLHYRPVVVLFISGRVQMVLQVRRPRFLFRMHKLLNQEVLCFGNKCDGCTHLDSVIASVNVNPVATTPFTDTHICEGDNVTLGSSGGGSYEWIPATGLSSTIIPNPVAHRPILLY